LPQAVKLQMPQTIITYYQRFMPRWFQEQKLLLTSTSGEPPNATNSYNLLSKVYAKMVSRTKASPFLTRWDLENCCEGNSPGVNPNLRMSLHPWDLPIINHEAMIIMNLKNIGMWIYQGPWIGNPNLRMSPPHPWALPIINHEATIIMNLNEGSVNHKAHGSWTLIWECSLTLGLYP